MAATWEKLHREILKKQILEFKIKILDLCLISYFEKVFLVSFFPNTKKKRWFTLVLN